LPDAIAAVSDRPTRRQQQRSLITQQKLLGAAIEAFSENGFNGTSTRDIAERAGVHHPLITYHFKNKEQLWQAAADKVFKKFGAQIAQALQECKDCDAKARFALYIDAIVQHAYEQPAIHRMIVQEAGYPNPRMDWLVERHLQPFFEANIAHISELQELGVMPSGDPAMIYHMIRLSATGMLAIRHLLHGTSSIDLDGEQARKELVDMIVRVYLPGEVKSSS
jgi:AcrR family transcriptional regulator